MSSLVRAVLPFTTATVVLLAAVACSAMFERGRARDAEQIEALIRRYETALTTGDVPTIVALYSSEPVFMPEYAPAASGRESVRAAYEWVFRTLKLNGRFHVHEIHVTGDIAWARTSSTGQFTVIATAIKAEVGNHEFFLFRREADGWKIHRYIFAASRPQS